MLQPKKDNFRLSQADQSILEKEMIAYAEEGASDDDLIEFKNTYVAEKKKGIAKSEPASTPQKSVSETPIGSSGGVNSKMKTFNGLSNAELKKVNSQDKPLPAINQNIKNKIKEKSLRNELKSTKVTPENMESISLKTDNLSKITKENQESDALYERNKKDDYSFLDYSKDTAISGVGTFYKSIADTPELLYDIATQTFINPRLEAEGSPFLLKTGDEVADDLGLKNIPADILQVQIKEANDRIKSYSDKNGIDPLKAIQDGNYSGAAKLIAGTTIQSAPLMIAAILSGGSSLGLTAVGVSSAATQNSDLKAEHPEMNVNTRIKNAVATGVIEATVGSLFTGASGAVAKRIIADKGVEAGSKIIAKSFRGTLEKTVAKNPIVGAVGEMVEEGIVEGAHQTKDIISGIREDYDLHAIGNASVSSTGMGGVNTLAVYGAKGYVKAKDYAKLKSTNKEVFKLRSEIENGNLSDENKAILGLRADRLEADNKKLLGTEIEKVKALPSDVKTELNALNEEFESLKSKFDDIDDADDIPDNLKPAMKEEIKIQAAKNQKRKTEILSQNDGLEVDNDFSNFDGVEPDFNLENGKISSLPLKEQDRLNKLAVEQITGGDKTIEYTKEQVSQTANEIYKNEQTSPTPEAQPQAEVPQQAEAEKIEIKNEGKSNAPTKENIDERLRINHPFYEKVSDALNKLGLISKYNPETKEGDVIGGYTKPTSDGGFSVGGFIFSKDGSVSFIKDGTRVEFDKNGNVISENTKEVAQEKNKIEIEGTKERITNLEKTRDSEAFKYKEVTETDVLGNRKKVKRLKTTEELKESTDKINDAINKAKSRLTELEKNQPQATPPVEDVVAPSVEKSNYVFSKSPSLENAQAINIEESNISNEPEITERIINNENHWDKALLDGVKNEGNGWFEVGKTPQGESILHAPSTKETVVIKDSENKGGRNGVYKNNFIENNPRNEATPPTNPPADGNVQLGASNVGESGNAKQESPVQESVPSSVDGGEVKGDASVGKIIEPHSEVNTDVETVKKELKLNEVESLVYDSFKDIPKDEIIDKVDDVVEKWKDDKYGEIEAIESKINDIDIKIEDNGVEIDQINDAENMTAAKKKKAVAVKEKEYEDLQKQQKELEEQKEAVNESLKQIDDVLFHPTEDYNIDLINEVVDKVNNRLETRKSIKEGTNLFPDDANIPEFVAVKKELIKLTDEKTIAEFNNRTAEQIEESKPIIKDIESKAENAERISKKELEKGIDDAEKLLKKPTTKERISERIKLSDAKVDATADAVKAKLKAFADMFPSADINPDDYHTNGFSADAIIDMVAKAAKAIAKGGIVTSEHIKEAIKAYNTHFDDEIDPKLIEERINPKKEAEKNSKDLLSKMTDVPNSGEIGKYISRDNIEDSDAEEEFTTNQDYDKLKLIDSLIYGKEIVEQAKADFGDNYIDELIKNINAIKNVDSKTLHIISLENDLRQRRKETTDVQEKEFLTEQINRLQPISQKLANTVSRALNLNKLRKLSESGVNPNDKSNSIYTKEELETKHEIGKSFGKDINDIQEQYEESFQDETDAVETAPDNEENILKYSQKDFDRELQKAKDELGNDYNISVFENLKRQAKKDKLSDKKEDLKSAKAKVLEDIRKVVRESMGQMSVNPLAKPLEFATLVTKLAKLHIQDGALSLEEVSNSIYNDLKDMSKDITKESIFNILKSKPKKVMSEATKRKIYITLLNKNIESLDAQIKAKKRDVINRIDKYKNDAEIKYLRDKRAEKRDELAKVDPSYAESRKLATDLKTAQKSLDEYQRRIDENELSPKENQPKVVAEKLKKLRERRDAKRKEFLTKKKKYDDSLKPVAVPPTKEELVEKKYLSDVKNKINSLTKRIEDLKANKLKTNDGKSTIWNAKISELENELGKLKEKTKGGKETVKEKQNLTEEEIFQKKIDQKIRQTEKALQDHKAKKPKFAVGANSVWSKELSTIKTELTNLRNESSDAKKKAREIKNKAIELLINSGYGKEINVTKKEVDAEGNVVKVKSTKKILDWKKLAGESGSIANISKEIEKVLADQNLSKNEISEMVTEMKTAIEEIKTSITEKSLTDLQNRNKIPKTVNVKTEAKNLSELYNQGIFDDNMDKYDIALNRILGFNKFKESQYQDLKDYSRLLSNLFSNQNIFGDTNEFMSEDALKTQIAHINKQINEIVNKASMGKGVTTQKVVSIIRDYSDMALLAKLLSLKQAVQNPISGYTERLYQKIGSIFDEIKLTPELKKQLDKGAWKVFKDITISGSPDLGDSSFSDIRSRKIDDKIRGIKMGKNAGKVRDAVSSIVSGTAYLNGADAYNKVKILEAVFAKAMIDILSNKNYGRNNIMTVKEATIFVSEALTGESFSKAIAKARQIIKDTNNEAGKDILPYTDANIYRLAMDVIRDNLTSTGIVDTETVKAVFAGSFKAAGSSLGHESNNPISTIYKNSSQFLDRKIKESVKEKNWGNFALYVSVNLAKNITMPFVSGRFNWAFLGAQITGANLGLSTVVTAYQKNKNKIDFSTEEGRSLKNLTESVHRKIRHDQTIKRSVVGLSLNVLVISALAASGGDDELEKFLEKSPNIKKVFKWIFPMIVLYFASQKGGKRAAIDFLLDFYSITGNEDRGSAITQFEILLDDKSTDKQNAKAKGVVGKAVGKAFDTPIPWRLGRDVNNVLNEIKGKEQYTANYNATSFLSGAFQGGFFEAIGIREMLSGQEEEKYIPKEDRPKKGAFSPTKPKLPSLKFNANPQ